MNPELTRLIERAVDSVREMQATGGRRTTLLAWTTHATAGLPNEMTLFIKPEITRPDHPVQVRAVMDLLAGRFEDFGIEVTGLVVLGADYLRDHGLIAQHYGVIHEVSRLGLEVLAPAAAAKALALRKGGEPVLGGHQLLSRHPALSAQSLGTLWDRGASTKLGSGTYAQRIRVGSEDVVGLNGFHPAQLTHFTEPGRSIVVMAIRSKTSWRALRQAFLGATDPTRAAEGSFRRCLVNDREKLGLPQVNQGLNGAHLSAGPVEGLAELLRYFSDHDRKQPLELSETVLGSGMLRAGLGREQIERLLRNARLYGPGGKLVPTFDLTEELDTRDALELVLRSARQGGEPPS